MFDRLYQTKTAASEKYSSPFAESWQTLFFLFNAISSLYARCKKRSLLCVALVRGGKRNKNEQQKHKHERLCFLWHRRPKILSLDLVLIRNIFAWIPFFPKAKQFVAAQWLKNFIFSSFPSQKRIIPSPFFHRTPLGEVFLPY